MTDAEFEAAIAEWQEQWRDDARERAALIADGCKVSREEANLWAVELLRPRVWWVLRQEELTLG